MKKTRKNLLILVILIATLTLGVLPVSAQAERYEFEATQKFNSIGPPERVWDNGGIHHVRNQAVVLAVTGDVNGYNNILQNTNTDIVTGDGVTWADIVLDLKWGDLAGTFEGKSHAPLVGGFNIGGGKFVGQGTGDFEGMTMFAEFYRDTSTGTPISVLRGTILVHGGK